MTDIKRSFKRAIKKSAQQVESFAEHQARQAYKQLERAQDRRICLGVTGLSQSGKSTFITSLINQLLHHKQAQLSGFEPALNQRILWVKQQPLTTESLPEFPYQQAYQAIASENPCWPDSTVGASGCLLEIRMKRQGSRLNPLVASEYSLFVEIRDYPGEWLLDLPLMNMDYSRWCAQCSAQFNREPRASIMGELLQSLRQIDPLQTADRDYLKKLQQQFIAVLKRCKNHHKSLSLIQPGRFLISGLADDQDLPCFVPLLNTGSSSEGQLQSADEDSYFKVCQSAYQDYVDDLVKPFYKQFFSKIDRQIVLVDVVSALNAGPEYIEDMRQALTHITDSFHYGKQSRLWQLFRPRIDKVVYAATKVDQVISAEHNAVRELLNTLVKQAYRNAEYQGVTPSCEAVAAVRASHELQREGESVPGLVGIDCSQQRIGYIHPTIPHRIPEKPEQWQPFIDWQIPRLNPPTGLSAANEDPIPHIRMDLLLNQLLGDKCK